METFLQNLFVDVINMSITASYVILFVIIVRQFLKKAPRIFSYSLWSIALFRLVCPLSFSSAFSFLQATRGGSGKMEYIPSNIGMMAQPQINTGIKGVDSVINASLPMAIPHFSASPVQTILVVFSMIWILGILSLLLYSAISYLLLKRKIRTAMFLQDNVFESENIFSAFVLGIIKPKIYLPIGLKCTEKNYIIKHELIHIRRADYFFKPFAFFALCVHWFNPLVWLGFVLMTQDMEMSCDERVLRELGTDIKGDYSTSLLFLAVGGKTVNASPIAFGEGNVKSRIKNILNYKKPPFWVIIVATVVVAGIGIGLMTNPKNSASDPSNLTVNSTEPTKIQITVDGAKINYIVGLNQWNGAVYDRADTFQTIMKGRTITDIPYIQLNKVFQIEFKGTAPDSVRLQDYILDTNANVKYTEKEIRIIPIEFKNKTYSFTLTAHPAALFSSYSSDYEPGSSIRGFRLTCKWGANDCEYAFIIRSDAR